MKAHLRHGALAMVLCTMAGSVNAQERLTTVVPEPKAFPTYSIDSNVVYGRMEYSVEMTQATADAKRSFQNFLRRAVIQAFGSEDGNYVITLVVKNGGVEIAKKAISSFTWKNKNFLFFATESSVTSEISFSGRLLDHFPVTNNNNSLQVGLQIQNTKTVALDTATYNKFRGCLKKKWVISTGCDSFGFAKIRWSSRWPGLKSPVGNMPGEWHATQVT
jgi:hypothetical protein